MKMSSRFPSLSCWASIGFGARVRTAHLLLPPDHLGDPYALHFVNGKHCRRGDWESRPECVFRPQSGVMRVPAS